MFSIILFATLVQILLIEYTRTTTMAALRDAARAGAKVTDLRRASGPGGNTATAVSVCKSSASDALHDLNGADSDDVICSIGQDAQGNYYMRASIENTFDSVHLIPGAEVFKGRLSSLSATYTPSEAAR